MPGTAPPAAGRCHRLPHRRLVHPRAATTMTGTSVSRSVTAKSALAPMYSPSSSSALQAGVLVLAPR